MSVDLIAPLEILNQNGSLTPTSLSLPQDLPLDQWRQMGLWLGGLRDLSAWSLGDWQVFGDESYGEDEVNQAVEATGLAKSTLLKYKWLSAQYAPSQRVAGVSPTHHELVAKLPAGERRQRLLTARRDGLSVEEFRGLVREDSAQKECTCIKDGCPKHGVQDA